MEITFSVFNGQGMKSHPATGKALRRLTAAETLEALEMLISRGRDIAQYTVQTTAGDIIPADWFIEDHAGLI